MTKILYFYLNVLLFLKNLNNVQKFFVPKFMLYESFQTLKLIICI